MLTFRLPAAFLPLPFGGAVAAPSPPAALVVETGLKRCKGDDDLTEDSLPGSETLSSTESETYSCSDSSPEELEENDVRRMSSAFGISIGGGARTCVGVEV